jgi:hypothetical protein
VLLNPYCPFSTARVLALKATVLLLLTLLIKAKIRITAFSALGFFLLLLQTPGVPGPQHWHGAGAWSVCRLRHAAGPPWGGLSTRQSR